MQQPVDPYRDWLGRTAPGRPLDYYQLLDLPRFEEDPHRIGTAEMATMAKVLRYERGEHAKVARRLMQEIDEACATLSDPEKKAAYDAQLRAAVAADAVPNYYSLLDLPEFEQNIERIETAQMIQLANLLRDEAQLDSQTVAECREALDAALAILTDPAKKAHYDDRLRAQRTVEPQNVFATVDVAVEVAVDPPANTTVAPELPPARRSLDDLMLPDEEDEVLSMPVRSIPAVPAPAAALVNGGSKPPAAHRSAAIKVQEEVRPPLDLSISEEEEDLLSAPVSTSAPAVTTAIADRNAAGSTAEPYSAQSDESDVGLADPPAETKKGVKPQQQARQELLKQFRTSAAPPVASRGLPVIPVQQIVKVGGGIAIVAGLVWGAMTLFAGGPPTGQPSGRIMLAGQPIVGAEMTFVPADDPDQLFIGVSGADGQYQVSYRTFDGLPVGRYQVTITRYELPGGKSLEDSEESDVLKSDAKPITQTFEREITRGSNSIDFELAESK